MLKEIAKKKVMKKRNNLKNMKIFYNILRIVLAIIAILFSAIGIYTIKSLIVMFSNNIFNPECFIEYTITIILSFCIAVCIMLFNTSPFCKELFTNEEEEN